MSKIIPVNITTTEQAQALACPDVDEIIQIDGIYYIQKL